MTQQLHTTISHTTDVRLPAHVTSFADSAAFAHALETHLGRVHCALLLSDYGNVLDFCVLDEPDDSVYTAATWAEEVKRLDGPDAIAAVSAVLVSTGHENAGSSIPADVAVLDQLRARLHMAGLFLRDWVQTSGPCERSVTTAVELPAYVSAGRLWPAWHRERAAA